MTIPEGFEVNLPTSVLTLSLPGARTQAACGVRQIGNIRPNGRHGAAGLQRRLLCGHDQYLRRRLVQQMVYVRDSRKGIKIGSSIPTCLCELSYRLLNGQFGLGFDEQ